jgi:DNA-binding transcriptional LysR family regulator
VRLERFSEPAAGPVRVSALAAFFEEVLIERLTAFRDRYPDIEITMQAATSHVDLAREEADIAIRSPRPKQPNLICRRAFRIGNALYAARSYVDRFGLPKDLKHAEGHFLARYAEDLNWVPEEKWLDRHVRGARVAARATTEKQQLSLVENGIGIGFIECRSGDAHPNLQRLPSSPVLSFTYWLTVHEDTYKAPRVRIVLDWLADVCRDVEPAYLGA